MATYDNNWFEVWYIDGVDYIPSHLLIVTPKPDDQSRIMVVDPYLNGKIVYESKNYQDAYDWLTEDEYMLVNGREFPDG